MASKSKANTTIVRMKEFDQGALDYVLRKAGEQNPKPNASFFKNPKNVMLVSYTNEQLSGFLWAHILIARTALSEALCQYVIIHKFIFIEKRT